MRKTILIILLLASMVGYGQKKEKLKGGKPEKIEKVKKNTRYELVNDTSITVNWEMINREFPIVDTVNQEPIGIFYLEIYSIDAPYFSEDNLLKYEFTPKVYIEKIDSFNILRRELITYKKQVNYKFRKVKK